MENSGKGKRFSVEFPGMVRKFFAFFFILVAVLIIPAAVLLSALGTTLLDESHVETHVVPRSYEVAKEWLLEEVAESRGLDSVPAQWPSAFGSLLTTQEYEKVAMLGVTAFFKAIEEPTGGPISVDFQPIRSELRSVIAKKIEDIPICTQDDLKKPVDPVNLLPECMPPDAPTEISTGLERGVPPRLIIGEQFGHNDVIYWLSTLHSIRDALPLLAGIIVLIVLGIIGGFAYTSLQSMFRWIAAALIAVAASLGLFVSSIRALVYQFVDAGEFTQLQSNSLNLFINPPLNHVALWALGLGILGLIGLVLAFALKSKPAQ